MSIHTFDSTYFGGEETYEVALYFFPYLLSFFLLLGRPAPEDTSRGTLAQKYLRIKRFTVSKKAVSHPKGGQVYASPEKRIKSRLRKENS